MQILLKLLQEEFILSKDALDLDCHNHFQKVRRKIDMHREKLKEKIYQVYIEMIDRTKEFETSYLKNFNENLKSSVNLSQTILVEEEVQNLEKVFGIRIF